MPEVQIGESFKRKLSKREKKQLKKLQEKTKAAEAAKSAAEKLYNGMLHRFKTTMHYFPVFFATSRMKVDKFYFNVISFLYKGFIKCVWNKTWTSGALQVSREGWIIFKEQTFPTSQKSHRTSNVDTRRMSYLVFLKTFYLLKCSSSEKCRSIKWKVKCFYFLMGIDEHW